MSNAPAAGFGGKITRNALFHALGYGWQGATILFLVPFIIHNLDAERYGLWALLVAVVKYFDLADVAGENTLTKFVAEHHAQNEDGALRKIVGSGVAFYLVLAVGIALLGAALTTPLLALLKVPPHLLGEARVVYWLVVATFSVTIIGDVFRSVLAGLMRLDIFNGVSVVTNTLKVVGAVVALRAGWGLVGLALSELAVAGVSLLLLGGAAKFVYPSLHVNPLAGDRATLRRIVGFGGKLQISNLAELIHFQLDYILISRLGMQYVAYYDIGSRLLKYARGFPLAVTASVVPAIAQLAARGDHGQIAALYRKGSRYLVATALLIFGALFATADALINLWVGPTYEMSVYTLRLLAVGYFGNLMTGLACFVSIGLGKPGYVARVAVVQVALNIALSVGLILAFGYYGAVIGTLLAAFLGGVYFIVIFSHEVDHSLAAFGREILARPVWAALMAIVVSAGVQVMAARMMHPAHTSGAFATILMAGVISYVVVYGSALWKLAYLRRKD